MIRWPLTFYTIRFVPKGFAGCARGPVIFIRPEYKDDYGLYRHERVHVRQWITSLGLHSVLYLLSDRYKLECELEAYREQLLHYDTDKSELFSKFISESYGLSISQQNALLLLLQ